MKKSHNRSAPHLSIFANEKNPHTELLNGILIEGSKIQGLVIWRNETGVARTLDGERIVRYGLVGSSDIIGILYVPRLGAGIFIGIECKTGGGVLSEKQKKFQKMIVNTGGLYIQARSVDDTLMIIRNFLNG